MVGLLCRRRPLSTLFGCDTDLREDLIIMLAQQRRCALRRAAAPVEKGRAPREGDRPCDGMIHHLEHLRVADCGFLEHVDRKRTRMNSSHQCAYRMPSSAL